MTDLPPNDTADSNIASGDTEPFSPETAAALDAKHKHANLFNPNNDILRILPTDQNARLAFHELATMRDELSQHHSQFMFVREQKVALGGQGYDSGPSEEAEHSSDGSNEQLLFGGYFRLHFECQPLLPGGRYVMGRGVQKMMPDQNVDILLAALGSKRRHRMAPAHAFLRLHRDSGAWLLQAGFGKHSTDVLTPELMDSLSGFEDCDHEPPIVYDGDAMRHAMVRCLCKPRSTLVVAGMHFTIQFNVNESSQEKMYLRDRAIWLRKREFPFPDTDQSGIPFESDIKTKWAVFRQGLGSGTFGVVFEGLDPYTGDLRAVKKLAIKDRPQLLEVKSEVRICEDLADHQGLVRTYGWCNQYGEPRFMDRYPFEIYIFQEKGISFWKYDWRTEPTMKWIDRRRLCKQLLEGLAQIHGRGWMHRDITGGNVLLFPNSKPPRAALCDYGKLCKEPKHNLTGLAAWRFLPPEIVTNSLEMYDQKIDIWLLGLTLVYGWFPKSWMDGKELRNRQHHTKILAKLADPAKSLRDYDNGAFLEDAGAPAFASLLRRMLAWKAEDRPTAAETLEDESMKIEEEKPESSGLKRPLEIVI